MTTRTLSTSLPALALLLALLPAVGSGAEHNPVRSRPAAADMANTVNTRIIVKFRAPQGSARMQTQSVQTAAARAGALIGRAGLRLKQSAEIGRDLQLLQLEQISNGETPAQVLARLRADADVEYAEPDHRRHPHAIPNDPYYPGQWYLQSSEPSAIRAEQAWDATTGSPNVVIAILDTGILFDHPDLLRMSQGGRLLPGYDFVSGPAANDGNGWDANPADPGDWISAQDQQQAAFSNCDQADSSWHGTRVAGMIGAVSNNARGIAGITWGSPILPVRVLGKCGGFDSDIIPAMRWAAGLHVPTVPANPNPARIINMSLGSDSICSPLYADTIAELAEHGVLVVASAGNDVGAAVSSPASCPGVLAVAGLRHVGTKVGYSNIGPEVGISAPAGNCVNLSGPCLFSLDTTIDRGRRGPRSYGYSDQYRTNLGTSFSAPIVAAVAALVRSVNSSLTPAQTIIRLQQSATTFPVISGVDECRDPAGGGEQLECNCTTDTCGAGMLNAAAAVEAAQRPFVIASASPTSVSAGQIVNLNGSASFAADGRTIASYAWSVVSAAGSIPALTGANLANASFTAASSGSITLRLTVVDSQGAQDSADVVVATPAAPQATPAPSAGGGSGNSGGGGGALLLELLLLAMTLIGRRSYRS